jgi:hypothetical protein
VLFSFTSTEPGTFQCRIDGPGSTVGSYQSCASTASYSSLADGSYTFSVRAIDTAGNVDATPATRSFTIVPPATEPGPILAPPAPSITSPGNYSWVRSSTVTISGTASPGSTVEVFDDSSSRGTTVVTAAGTWSRVVTGVTEGSHLFTAKASNAAGTSPASSIRVVSVDTIAPTTPTITAPAAASTVGSSFTLTGTAEPGTTVEVFEDGSSRGTLAVSGNGTWSRSFSSVTTGNRSYTARSTDIAGNVSGLSATRTFRVN